MIRVGIIGLGRVNFIFISIHEYSAIMIEKVGGKPGVANEN